MPHGYATYDLHLHTYWSYDACASVEYYFRRARELKLRRIAITEHFTMDSLQEIREVSRKYPDVQFIPGVELTVRTPRGYNVDLLCLGIPMDISPELQDIFQWYRELQQTFGAAFSLGMRALGYDYGEKRRLELLRTYRPQHVLDVQGATHVQSQVQKRYFIQRGFVANESEYKKLHAQVLSKIAWPAYPDADKVIPIVKRTGALVVVAHPCMYFKEDEVRQLDDLREVIHFDGVECAHNTASAAMVSVFRKYCKERDLVCTAGSDCHADPSNNPHGIAPQHEFARHLGEDRWLEDLLARLPRH